MRRGTIRSRTEPASALPSSGANAALPEVRIGAGPDGILLTDRAGRVVAANQAAGTILGFQNGAIIGQLFPFPLAPEQITEQEIPDLEGHAQLVEVSVTPMTWAGVDGYLLLVRDVTAPVRAARLRRAAQRISEAALTAENLPGLYQLIYQILGDVMPVSNFFIALYDPSTDLVSFPCYIDEHDPTPEPEKLGPGFTAHVIRTGQPLLVSAETLAQWQDRSGTAPLGTAAVDWLGVPLKVHGRTIGVLAVQSYTPTVRYSPTEQEILVFISGQVAMAIERKQAEEALLRRADELAALRETSLNINAQGDLQSLLQAIIRRAAEMLGARMGALYLMQPDGQTLLLAVSHNLPENLVGIQLRLGEGLSGRIAQSGQPLIVGDYMRWAGRAPIFEDFPFHRVLGVPLKLQDQIIGVLNVTDDQKAGDFTEAEVQLATLFAQQAAISIVNARLLEDTRQRAAELEALLEASLSLTSSLDLRTVLQAILSHTLKLLPGINAAHVFLYRSGVLVFGAVLWSDGRTDQPVAMPRQDGLTYAVARQGEIIAVPDMRQDPLFVGAPTAWQGAIVGLPLKIGARVVGVMNVSSNQPRTWSEAELRIMRLLASQAAIAIENAQLLDEIRQHASELAVRVAARTAELSQREVALQAANEQLKELDSLKSQFVSNVSHELRTPLANIRTYLHLLERGEAERRAQYLATVRREVELLHDLIEDLLQLTRLDARKVTPDLVPVDVNTLVSVLAEDRAVLLSDRGLTLTVQVQRGLPPVMADSKILKQVLTNLMTNAMNYTPRGGRISVRSALQEREGRPWVTFAVADTGYGIGPEDQEHLFDRFYRGEAARLSKVQGTGLGLAICAELVKKLNGRITVESEPGHGSTFTVWLPPKAGKVTGRPRSATSRRGAG